jgi:ribosomal protein L37AE/L43A
MRVKFCPKCKSTDLVMMAGGNIGIWKCKKCSYQGSVFPEKEIKLKENKKSGKRKKNENLS